MSIVRVGATKQYSDNWDNIFSGSGRKSSAKKASAPARKSAKKASKASAKAAAKKRAGGAKRRRK